MNLSYMIKLIYRNSLDEQPISESFSRRKSVWTLSNAPKTSKNMHKTFFFSANTSNTFSDKLVMLLILDLPFLKPLWLSGTTQDES